MKRLLEQSAVGPEQREVDSPRIDADPVKRNTAFRGGDVDPSLDFVPEPGGVPLEAARFSQRSVGESM